MVDHSVCTCEHPRDALETHLLRRSHGDERTAAHNVVRDAVYYITRDVGRAIVRAKILFIPSSIPAGWGKRVGLVISEPSRRQNLLDVVIAAPTHVELVARATIVPPHAA